MGIKLLTKHHVEFVSLKGGCTGSFESTLFKMLHCWKSRVTAHLPMLFFLEFFLLCGSGVTSACISLVSSIDSTISL